MLTALRIWSGLMAVVFAAVETHLNLTVYHGKPLPILLPYYVIAAWLLAGALARRHTFHLLVSAWGVTLGHTYLVWMENLLLRDSASMLVTALRNTTVTAALCLVLANYCVRTASAASGARHSTPVVRVVGILLAALLFVGQLSTAWGEGKPAAILLPYFVLAALLLLPVLIRRLAAALILSIWSVGFGYLYAEFAGFLVFFERPPHIVVLAGVASTAALTGVILQSIATASHSAKGTAVAVHA